MTTARRVAFTAALVASPVAAVGGLEALSRFVFHYRHGYSYDQALAYLPDRALVFRVNPQHHSWQDRQDRLAIIRSPASFGGPGPGPRVWILGGSTSEPQPSQTEWPEILRRQLRGLEVINMAHSGYGTSQMRWLYREYRLQIRPRAVILFEGWNGRGAAGSPYGWRPANAASPFDRLPQRLSAPLINRSAFYGISWHLVDRILARPCHSSSLPPAEVASWAAEYEALVNEISHSYRTFLVLFPGLAMREDARVALPERLACVGQTWATERTLYLQRVEVIRAIARRLEVPLLDPTAAYVALPLRTYISLFSDPAHQTTAGNEFLGRAIARELRLHEPVEPLDESGHVSTQSPALPSPAQPARATGAS